MAELTRHVGRDHLTIAEFERRVDRAYGAPSAEALANLVADLAPLRGEPERVGLPARISALCGSAEYGGDVAVPDNLELRAIAGNVHLDLARARFCTGVTEIDLRAIVSNLTVTLPSGVAVENQTHGVLGSFRCSRKRKTAANAPQTRVAAVVRFTGAVIASNVTVTFE